VSAGAPLLQPSRDLSFARDAKEVVPTGEGVTLEGIAEGWPFFRKC